mmetsp:Transcript_1895/g.7554  ORF Transcript_1895/g.7554 Transcript_1895/m.7554 type:complete len:215 (+) Transcript_1895:364-1008(+)
MGTTPHVSHCTPKCVHRVADASPSRRASSPWASAASSPPSSREDPSGSEDGRERWFSFSFSSSREPVSLPSPRDTPCGSDASSRATRRTNAACRVAAATGSAYAETDDGFPTTCRGNRTGPTPATPPGVVPAEPELTWTRTFIPGSEFRAFRGFRVPIDAATDVEDPAAAAARSRAVSAKSASRTPGTSSDPSARAGRVTDPTPVSTAVSTDAL